MRTASTVSMACFFLHGAELTRVVRVSFGLIMKPDSFLMASPFLGTADVWDIGSLGRREFNSKRPKQCCYVNSLCTFLVLCHGSSYFEHRSKSEIYFIIIF